MSAGVALRAPFRPQGSRPFTDLEELLDPVGGERGTRTERFGISSRAFAATSCPSASRTGIGLVPKDAASFRRLMTCPGMKAPTISPSRIRLAIWSWTCPRFGVGTILAFGSVDCISILSGRRMGGY